MILSDLIQKVQDTPLAEWVRSDVFAFPVLEAVHVAAIMLVVGSIAMLDLRLIGVSSRSHAVTKLSNEVLPWTWVSFALAVVTGGLLFIGQASSYAANLQFRIKLVLLVLAGLNMVVFHFITWRSVQSWNTGEATPLGAKLAGGLSLAFWIAVVIFGRWVGWTLSTSPF